MLRTSGVLGSQLARFFGAGAANTIGTFALLQALLLVLPSTPAYLIAWLAGLAIVVIFYPRRVFGQRATSWQRRTTYGGIYLGIFLSGLLLLR
jgi:NADH:ubiquinone oxidoreductase subunit 4 (subunit M)